MIYEITVKDTETGEETTVQTNCYILAANQEKSVRTSIAMHNTNSLDYAAVISTLQDKIKEELEEYPEVKALIALNGFLNKFNKKAGGE